MSSTKRPGGRLLQGWGLDPVLLIGLSTHEQRSPIVGPVEGALQQVVGGNLRRLRREGGLSQEAFGEQVGWHRTFVGAVERGERNLTLQTVERLCDQLGIHPFDLLWNREGLGVTLSHGDVIRVEPGVDRIAAGHDGTAALAAEARDLGPAG